MNRKWLSASLICMFIMSMVLSACGSKENVEETKSPTKAPAATEAPEATEAPAEKVTLRIASVYTPDHPFGPAIAQIIENFTKEHPEVTVEKEFMPGDQLKTKLSVDLAANSLPEIFVAYPGNGSGETDMAKGGKMLDLSTDLNADTEWKDGFIAGALDNYKYGLSGNYAAPIGAFGVGFFYNKELFQKAGVQPPTTWTELLAVIKALNAAEITPWALGNADNWRSEHLLTAISLKLNGPEAANDVGARKITYSSPEIVDAFGKLAELAHADAFGKNYVGLNYAGEVADFNNGKAAMRFSGSWTAGEVAGQDVPAGFKDKVGFFAFPSFEGKDATKDAWFGGTSDAFAISNNVTGHQKNMAIALVKALTSADGAKLISETAHDLTAVKSDVDPAKAGSLIAEITKAMSTATAFGGDFAAPELNKAVNAKVYELAQAVLAKFTESADVGKLLDDAVAKNE